MYIYFAYYLVISSQYKKNTKYTQKNTLLEKTPSFLRFIFPLFCNKLWSYPIWVRLCWGIDRVHFPVPAQTRQYILYIIYYTSVLEETLLHSYMLYTYIHVYRGRIHYSVIKICNPPPPIKKKSVSI